MKTIVITGMVAFLAGGLTGIVLVGEHEISSRRPTSIGDFVLRETPAIQLQSYTSPDKRHVATVAFKYDNPQLEGHFWTMVSIDSVEEGVALGRGPQPIRLYGSTSISCEWLDAQHLRISYAGALDADYTMNLMPECASISIEYCDLLHLKKAEKRKPNQSLEPTTMAVTPPAAQEPRQP